MTFGKETGTVGWTGYQRIKILLNGYDSRSVQMSRGSWLPFGYYALMEVSELIAIEDSCREG
jgi:hypothetical protein